MSKLTARRLEAGDLPLRVAWFNHPAVRSGILLETPVSLASTQRWFNDNLMNARRLDLVFLNDDDPPQLAAMTGLVDIDYRHRRCELYIVVDPARTGQGIGGLALQWSCNYAFRELGLHRVFLYTLEHNQRARHFYEHHGFRQEGVLRQHALYGGRMIDRYIHGLLREDWLALPWACSAGQPFGWTVALDQEGT